MQHINTVLRWAPLVALMGFGLAFALGTFTSDANATCLNERQGYLFLEPGLLQSEESIHVYLNAGADEDAPACPYDIRRTGLLIEDAESILRAVIVSVNDSSSTKPRLVYGGRVCHDTLVRNFINDAPAELVAMNDYHATWTAAQPNDPPGIVVQASPCAANAGAGELFDAIAWAVSFDRGPLDSVAPVDVALRALPGAGNIVFKAFQDDDGQLCPRIPFPPMMSSANQSASVGNAKPECIADAMGNPTGLSCPTLGAQQACTCKDLESIDESYNGYYVCFDPDAMDPNNDLQWSACKCRNRGYEARNIGDGTSNPNEPPRCDALGARDTKDLT
jgi:hypothetical protein